MPDDVVHQAIAKRIGTIINGKYRIDSVLGVGGMAVVYQATHRNGSKVAIKMLLPAFVDDPDTVRRFLREGYAANAVAHDGVVRVHDDDKTVAGSSYIVMELLEGLSVEELRKQAGGRLPQSWAIAFVYQLLEVLAAAHAKGIVHRDIKPSNVFLTRKGEIKLLDFGIARYREGEGAEHTITELVLGTPHFAAPEQMYGRQDVVDHRSDLYAAGATLFYLVAGQPPRGREGYVRTLGEVFPLVDGDLSIIVARSLIDRPDRRWQDAREMQRALSSVYCRLEGMLLPDGPSTLAAMAHRTSFSPETPYRPGAGILGRPAGGLAFGEARRSGTDAMQTPARIEGGRRSDPPRGSASTLAASSADPDAARSHRTAVAQATPFATRAANPAALSPAPQSAVRPKPRGTGRIVVQFALFATLVGVLASFVLVYGVRKQSTRTSQSSTQPSQPNATDSWATAGGPAPLAETSAAPSAHANAIPPPASTSPSAPSAAKSASRSTAGTASPTTTPAPRPTAGPTPPPCPNPPYCRM